MVIEQMSICSFTISNDESPHLNGFKIEVLTMNDVGFRRDDSRLLKWCLSILDDFLRGLTDRDDLVSESISIRITTADGKVL